MVLDESVNQIFSNVVFLQVALDKNIPLVGVRNVCFCNRYFYASFLLQMLYHFPSFAYNKPYTLLRYSVDIGLRRGSSIRCHKVILVDQARLLLIK